jgi:N-methylhydantoinase A
LSTWDVGIDIGGTFTDLVAVDLANQEIVTVKVPSTPSDPSEGFVAAIEEFVARIEESPDSIHAIFHGTTVATNALVQLRGARTGLLGTRGMRAIYEAERSKKPISSAETVNLKYQKRPLLVPQRLGDEVTERVSFEGEIITPLDENLARQAVCRLREKAVESVAVCLLFSFMNPEHEIRLREIILEEIPDCRVSLSSEVLPVIREYQRLSTTVVDAYVGPTVEKYLRGIIERLKAFGIKTRGLFLMQSSGGIMHISVGAKYPAQTALSGPAAGGMAVAYLNQGAGLGDYVVSYDMGGTSTDVSLLIKGRISLTTEGAIGQQDIGIPIRDIRTIGAGGGTVAWISSDDVLRVGPISAGADPGPACYGKGGEDPTVTDANLLLGYLNPDNFLGGKMKLQPSLAEKAVARIAKRLDMDVTAACDAILRLVENAMEVEIRICIMEKGYDPRVFKLVAFGGAGPLHATRMLKHLGIQSVLVPRYPGITSAMGLLMSNIEHYYMRSYLRSLVTVAVEDLNDLYLDLEKSAFADAKICGYDTKELTFIRQMDLRYAGQGYELTVPVSEKALREEDKALITESFNKEHLRIYNHNAPDIDVEVVNLRLVSVKMMPRFPLRRRPLGVEIPGAEALSGHRRVFFREFGWVEKTPIFDRSRLISGNQIKGPAVIEQEDSTVVVCHGQAACVDDLDNIIVQVAEVP